MGIPMKREGVEGVGEAVNENQLAVVWEPLGWRRVDPVLAAAGEDAPSLEGLTNERLRAIAEEQGVAVASRATKEEIITALRAAVAPETLETATAVEEV